MKSNYSTFEANATFINIFENWIIFKMKFKRLQDTVFSLNWIICYDSNLL